MNHSNTSAPGQAERPAVVPRDVFLPFCLVTTLFAFWGFANDVTNPLVRAFQEIFLISSARSSLVQTAFYGGYATMAIPAAIFIRRFSYKAGILVGLALYAIGALLFIPASITMIFWLFLIALYILTFGLAFLETTANPYVLAMGPQSTATRRLNFAQAFNPIGSLIGMVVASQVVLAGLGVQEFRGVQSQRIQAEHRRRFEEDLAQFQAEPKQFRAEVARLEAEVEAARQELQSLEEKGQETDAARERYNTAVEQLRDKQMVLAGQYQPMLAGRINARVMDALHAYRDGEIQFLAPVTDERGKPVLDARGDPMMKKPYESHQAMVAHDLLVVRLPYVVIGLIIVIALVVFAVSKLPAAGGEDREIRFFATLGRLVRNPHYVGGVVAQTFYVGAQIMCWTFIVHYAMINLNMSLSEAQGYNIIAMAIFCTSRFACTYLLKFVSPGGLLAALAAGGIALTTGTIFLEGMIGLYCLIGVSACMSLMFPTIYGIALDGLGEDAKLGSAGLIFAIVGGALMPFLQGWIVDMGDDVSGALTVGPLTLPAVNVSFALPLGCFVVIAIYGLLTHNIERPREAASGGT